MDLFIFDFDGTITTQDTTDLILEIPDKPEIWEIERKWQDGRITSYECMKTQTRFLKGVGIDKIEQRIKRKDIVDPYFFKLVKYLDSLNFYIVVLSEGYDLSIKLSGIGDYVNEVHVSKLIVNDRKLTGDLDTLNCERKPYWNNCISCCTCKVEYLKELNKRYNFPKTFAVGDGKSDTCLFQYVNVSFGLANNQKATYEIGKLADILTIMTKTMEI